MERRKGGRGKKSERPRCQHRRSEGPITWMDGRRVRKANKSNLGGSITWMKIAGSKCCVWSPSSASHQPGRHLLLESRLDVSTDRDDGGEEPRLLRRVHPRAVAAHGLTREVDPLGVAVERWQHPPVQRRRQRMQHVRAPRVVGAARVRALRRHDDETEGGGERRVRQQQRRQRLLVCDLIAAALAAAMQEDEHRIANC
eukprot:3472315-Pleurochrysis_carterae.AAC.1